MKKRAAFLLACVIGFSACRKESDVTISETRKESTRDRDPKLFATSDERFRDAKPSPVKATTPDGWLALPSSNFRLLNYRFGESGTGEVWVSISAGSVLDNANRWLDQFNADPLDAGGLAKLPTVPLAGTTGVWITAVGDQKAGMGVEARSGFALAGVIALVDGKILTVKMVGPEAEVEAARPVLETYVRSVRLAE